MTARAGILLDEFHSPAFSLQGGTMEMVQLWVNLPRRNKMAAPGYQSIASSRIPVVDVPEAAGQLRVIAAAFGGAQGAARTFTRMDVLDLRRAQGAAVELPAREGVAVALVVLRGRLLVNGSAVSDGQLVHLDREGSGVQLDAESDVSLLGLAGEPLDAPLAGRGPF